MYSVGLLTLRKPACSKFWAELHLEGWSGWHCESSDKVGDCLSKEVYLCDKCPRYWPFLCIPNLITVGGEHVYRGSYAFNMFRSPLVVKLWTVLCPSFKHFLLPEDVAILVLDGTHFGLLFPGKMFGHLECLFCTVVRETVLCISISFTYVFFSRLLYWSSCFLLFLLECSCLSSALL